MILRNLLLIKQREGSGWSPEHFSPQLINHLCVTQCTCTAQAVSLSAKSTPPVSARPDPPAASRQEWKKPTTQVAVAPRQLVSGVGPYTGAARTMQKQARFLALAAWAWAMIRTAMVSGEVELAEQRVAEDEPRKGNGSLPARSFLHGQKREGRRLRRRLPPKEQFTR